jgi:7-carboxy-7-deazaguanine synthase
MFDNMLKINEIYVSVQGESSKAGLPCVFIRLTYCNLRCTYCDTEYAFYEGKEYSIDQVIDQVKGYDCNLVEITGGEPLVQEDECRSLVEKLCDEGFEVLLETGGSLPIKDIDERVMIIMDLKCPSSGMMKKNFYDNISYLKQDDEIKFVIGNREDYNWTKEIINKYDLYKKCKILLSVVFNKLEPVTLVDWMLEDKINARFQLQMHKFIWQPDTKGV